MKNTFTHLKQMIAFFAIACHLPNLYAQQSAVAPSMLAEYELINDVEVFASGKTTIKQVYRKKSNAAGSAKAGNRGVQGKDIEPPMVIIIEDNGCGTGCTEHGWGSMGCLLQNKDNLPKNFSMGSDGHFYVAGKNAPLTHTAFSKIAQGNKSITEARKLSNLKQNSGPSDGAASIRITICNPPSCEMCCSDLVLPDFKKSSSGVPMQNFTNGTVTIRFGDTKNTYCLLPNGTVNKCDWVPTKEEISKM